VLPNHFEDFMERIGYRYADVQLLETALSHSSYANESRGGKQSNERLEFLGDSVLSVVVSDYLYRKQSALPEGDLTKLRSSLVCEKSLCEFAQVIGLGDFILLGRGEENSGGRHRPSIQADAFEAVIASIYLDSGIEAARAFILPFIKEKLARPTEPAFVDYKTQLQEIIQQNREERLSYVLVGSSGPDHNKSFCVEVHLNSNVIGQGEGRSKKEAEQQAARQALALMGR